MSAVWLGARTQLRRRVRATVLLVVLVGLAGGVVLAAVAGARRTDAALPRFVAQDHRIHALVYPPEEFEPRDPLAWQVQVVTDMPMVAAATRVTTVILASLDEPNRTVGGSTLAMAPMDAGGAESLATRSWSQAGSRTNGNPTRPRSMRGSPPSGTLRLGRSGGSAPTPRPSWS